MPIEKLNIKFNNPLMDSENIEKLIDKLNSLIDEIGKGTPYLTTAPTSDNPNAGYLIDVVLTAEPDDYYEGYRYSILASEEE